MVRRLECDGPSEMHRTALLHLPRAAERRLAAEDKVAGHDQLSGHVRCEYYISPERPPTTSVPLTPECGLTARSLPLAVSVAPDSTDNTPS